MMQYKSAENELYYRLVAFWVVCEAFAGGIMHAANIPFAGMIVSALAVTCIIFIGYYIPSKTAILRATMIVAVFKLMLSPQAPPTAYIAVFFQGLMGQLLFYNKRPVVITAVILAVLSLAESALQRVFVLLIISGNSFWHAVDDFVKKLVGGKDRHYSMMLAEGYILLHIIVGIFLGIFAVRLVKRSAGWGTDHPELLMDPEEASKNGPAKTKKKKVKWLIIILWIGLLLVFIQAYIQPKHAVLPSNEAAQIFLRSILIVLSWYLIFASLIMRLIRKLLNAQQQKLADPIKKIIQLIPGTKYVFIRSWKLAASEKGFRRLQLFFKILLVNILSENKDREKPGELPNLQR